MYTRTQPFGLKGTIMRWTLLAVVLLGMSCAKPVPPSNNSAPVVASGDAPAAGKMQITGTVGLVSVHGAAADEWLFGTTNKNKPGGAALTVKIVKDGRLIVAEWWGELQPGDEISLRSTIRAETIATLHLSEYEYLSHRQRSRR